MTKMFGRSCLVLFLLSLLFPPLVSGKEHNSQLKSPARQELIRELSSEYATLKVALPINKKGLTINESGDFDLEKNEEALLFSDQFIAAGITVQITKMSFDKNKLLFELNGGGKKKTRILEQIYAGTGVGMTPLAKPSDPLSFRQPNPQGSFLTIKFDKFIPDLTPEEVKVIVSSVLDFSRKSFNRSHIKTLSEEFRKAQKRKRATLGMDKDMVLGSMGQPLRRIRETKFGEIVEEWIYGERPHKVIFVEFREGIVVSLKEY